MSRARRQLLCALLLAAGLLLWGSGRALSRDLANRPLLYHLQYIGSVELPVQTQLQLEEEAGSFVFAQQSRETAITAPQFSRSRTVTWLEALGNVSLLLPGQPLLSGAYPQSGTRQCLIDEESALALWGSLDVAGKPLTMGEEEYQVSGVFSSKQPLLVTAWHGKGGFFASYGVYGPSLTAPFPKQDQEQFLSRNGLPVPDVVSCPSQNGKLLYQAAQLPLWVLGLLLSYKVIRQILPGEGSCIVWLRRLLLLFAVIVLGLALDFSLPFTPEQLPTRWSDFSYWSGKFGDWRDSLLTQWTLPGLVPAYQDYAGRTTPALLAVAASCCCMLLSLRLAPPSQEMEWGNTGAR